MRVPCSTGIQYVVSLSSFFRCSGSTVRNITFRDSYLYQTFKGIYLKFRHHDNPVWQGQHGHVEDILFENITIEEPIQWGVWIGPAQQADT
jgi:hypothetical protein